MKRWENPDIPEYDFDTGELVYRAKNGKELRRESFELKVAGERRETFEVTAASLEFQASSAARF
jgi:hypothetical protein